MPPVSSHALRTAVPPGAGTVSVGFMYQRYRDFRSPAALSLRLVTPVRAGLPDATGQRSPTCEPLPSLPDLRARMVGPVIPITFQKASIPDTGLTQREIAEVTS